MLAMYTRLLEVNPARAGMIHTSSGYARPHGRKPRASGDDPEEGDKPDVGQW